MIAKFFLTGNVMPCPARFFTSTEKALTWLNALTDPRDGS
ncbi:hypothetical protein [Arthrobacter sp. LjRoot14]